MFALPLWIAGLFLAALVTGPLLRRLPRLGVWPLAAVPAAAAGWFALHIGAPEPLVWRRPWVPGLEVELALRVDGLGLVFALLVCGIGALVVLFAGGYLAGKPTRAPTIGGLLAFAGAMLGLVLADDLLLLFICWEATSIASYLLVGLEHHRAEARAAARRALLITAGGGLALLGALVGLGVVGGTGRISELAPVVGDAGVWIAIGVLLGAFTKSAQFPFHVWLPGAMAAPTPVSAYLHSATMVKAGVYLVLRLGPTLDGVWLWGPALMVIGGLTALVGGLLAMAATDLKRVLACTTVAALGTMMLVAGLDHPLARGAALGLVVAHGLYKAALFMVAGGIEKAAGTRDLAGLGGLAGHRGLLAAAALAGLSMAAAPPLLGFVSKETALGLLWPGGVPGAVGLAVLAAAGAAFVYAALAVAREPFVGPARAGRPLSPLVVGPPLLLAVAGLAAGLFSAPLGRLLIDPVGGAPLGWALWHGFGVPLAASAASLGLGGLLWRRRRVFRDRAAVIDRLASPGPHDRLWDGLVVVARAITAVFQPAALRANLAVILLTAAGLVALALARTPLPTLAHGPMPDAVDAVLAAFLICGALGAARARHRLGAIGGLGAVGLGAALFYLRHGAPDLAMTQLLVEVLSVVLLMLAFRRLPALGPRRVGAARVWTAGVALAVGAAVAALVWIAGAVEIGPGIADWFAERAVSEGRGRNVVNVILVDFRALDTLGEIAVLGVAALGAGALLAGRREERAS